MQCNLGPHMLLGLQDGLAEQDWSVYAAFNAMAFHGSSLAVGTFSPAICLYQLICHQP